MTTELIDPLAQMQQIAVREEHTAKAASAVSLRRTQLVYGSMSGAKQANFAFLSRLVLALDPSPCWDIDTTSTDGKRFLYNPTYICSLSGEQLQAVLAQNVLHCAFNHLNRQGARDAKRWDIACDLAVNPIIGESGLQVPPGQPIPGQGKYQQFPLNQSAEEYYNLLSESDDDSQSDGGDAAGPSQTMPSVDQADASATESKWSEHVSAANADAGKKAGKLSAGLQRLCQEVLAPTVGWRDVLRQFVNSFSRNDYSFSPCNRRFVHMGLYLPSLRSEELGEIVVAVDCSGSVDQETLTQFAGELQGILDAFSVKLTIVYHDSKVCHVAEWSSEDGPLALEAHGGGGTSHRPVFEWVEEHKPDAIAVICLTDLYTCFPTEAPAQPVLWGVIANSQPTAPFGEIITID